MTIVRASSCILLSLIVMSWAGAALAENVEPITRARELFESFEYDDALEVLDAVVDDESAPPARRIQALEMIGSIRVLQNRTEVARETFNHLLSLDPGHQFEDPDIPPRVTALFDEAREAASEAAIPDLDLETPDAPAPDEDVEVTVVASGETGGLASIVLFVRRGPSGDFRALPTTRSGNVFEVDLDALGEDGVDVYVEARAPSGHVLTRVASADEPEQLRAVLPVDPDDGDDDGVSPPWYRRWWVWTIVGAVVVGGTVTGIVLGTQDDEHQMGTLGEVTMPLSGFERSR